MRWGKFIARRGVLAGVLATIARGGHAHDYRHGDIEISHPWAKPEPRASRPVPAFLTLINRGAEDRLIGGSSPFGYQVFPAAPDGRGLKTLPPVILPPGQPVELRPGGPFLMLLGHPRALNQGDRIPVSLRFQRAGIIAIEIMVEDAPAH